MIEIILFIIAADLVLLALFILFAAVMSLRRIRREQGLNGPMSFFGYQALTLGYFVDGFANCIFPVWLMFFDIPYRYGESLVTARLQRYYKQDSKRGKLSCWICDKIVHLLDPDHCIK